jgi:hypothetical protein
MVYMELGFCNPFEMDVNRVGLDVYSIGCRKITTVSIRLISDGPNF